MTNNRLTYALSSISIRGEWTGRGSHIYPIGAVQRCRMIYLSRPGIRLADQSFGTSCLVLGRMIPQCIDSGSHWASRHQPTAGVGTIFSPHSTPPIHTRTDNLQNYWTEKSKRQLKDMKKSPIKNVHAPVICGVTGQVKLRLFDLICRRDYTITLSSWAGFSQARHVPIGLQCSALVLTAERRSLSGDSSPPVNRYSWRGGAGPPRTTGGCRSLPDSTGRTGCGPQARRSCRTALPAPGRKRSAGPPRSTAAPQLRSGCRCLAPLLPLDRWGMAPEKHPPVQRNWYRVKHSSFIHKEVAMVTFYITPKSDIVT